MNQCLAKRGSYTVMSHQSSVLLSHLHVVCVCVSVHGPGDEQEEFVCECVCVCALGETDGKVWVTTRGHDTSWHTVGLSPPPILNLPPRLLCLPCFPSSFISAGCMYACVCVCVLGWRGWAPCDTWQRWARIRDVPAGEVVWCRGGGGEGYCIYCLSSWDLIKLTLHRPSAASHTHTHTHTNTNTHICKDDQDAHSFTHIKAKYPRWRGISFLSSHNEPIHDSRGHRFNKNALLWPNCPRGCKHTRTMLTFFFF